MASCWLSLRAVRRVSASDAFWAGFLAMLAVGLKQSIVGGLVFGGVLLIGSALARHLPWRATLRCALAAVVGAAVPVAAVVGWALVVGVRLEVLWYTSVGFRSDANRIIATQNAEAATGRIWVLLLVFIGVGMLLLVVCFLAQLGGLLRLDAVPVVAVLVMLAVDLAGVAVSGSYWMPYLFVPIPPLALALALLLSNDRVRGTRDRVNPAAIAFVVASSVVSLIGWTGAWVGGRVPVEVRTGEALDAIARPGDRVLVYGGRADIQWATHVSSPYPYLWSLPMRTRDPGLDELRSVLTGSTPPTWFVEASYINAWSELGTRPIESWLIRRYEYVVTACDRYRIYHHNTVDPVEVDVDCTTPYRTIWGL
jgi:glycerol uptake facilitator-like aquaporin